MRSSSASCATTVGRTPCSASGSPAPHVTATVSMPGRLAGEHVDDGVTDVDRVVRAAAHPLEREQQRRRVRLVPLGVLHRDEDLDVLAEPEDVHGLLRRLAALRGGDADVDAGGAQLSEHLTDAVVAADEPLGVVGVPLEVGRVELVRLLRRVVAEGAEERSADPRADDRRVLLAAEDGAEGMLVGLDDEVDRVGQRAVEVEDGGGPAGRSHRPSLGQRGVQPAPASHDPGRARSASTTTTSAREPAASDPRSASPSSAGRGARGGADGIRQRECRRRRPAADDVGDMARAAGDRAGGRAVGVAGEAGDAAVDDDREPAEDVGAVPHPGGGHGVGDEGDVVDADEVEDGAHRVVRQVRAVGDELDRDVATGGRPQQCRQRRPACGGATGPCR